MTVAQGMIMLAVCLANIYLASTAYLTRVFALLRNFSFQVALRSN